MIAHTNSLIKKKTSNSRFNKNLPNPLLKNLSPKKGFGDTDQKLLRWVGNYYCSQLFLLPILTLRTTLQNAGKHKGSMSTAHELHVIVFIMSGHGDHLHIMAVGGINDRILPLVSDAKIFAPEGKAGILALGHSCSLVLRRWRRLISPFAAVTKKPAVLSPGSLSCSILFITSWGILIVVICDFAFFAPVAISGSPKNWCMSVYAKKMIKKGLKCISLMSKLKNKGEIHQRERRPVLFAAVTGRLTTNR